MSIYQQKFTKYIFIGKNIYLHDLYDICCGGFFFNSIVGIPQEIAKHDFFQPDLTSFDSSPRMFIILVTDIMGLHCLHHRHLITEDNATTQ